MESRPATSALQAALKNRSPSEIRTMGEISSSFREPLDFPLIEWEFEEPRVPPQEPIHLFLRLSRPTSDRYSRLVRSHAFKTKLSLAGHINRKRSSIDMTIILHVLRDHVQEYKKDMEPTTLYSAPPDCRFGKPLIDELAA